MESVPFVSVVTPFYNTRDYLSECIESVLRQSYENWEYLLVDNCSTDGSGEIAANYVARFPDQLRLIRTPHFLSQVQNYNFALTCISPYSKYCKIVQADDWLFPDCIRGMVEVAETYPSVGIVAAYELASDEVNLGGLPYPSPQISGRDVCRLYFLRKMYLFGTPTSLLLRSKLVTSRTPFYEERYAPFEDGHVCFDLLKAWNFGFVHQVLTYSRRNHDSILSYFARMGFMPFARLAMVAAHGRDYLSEEEFNRCLKDAERQYFLNLTRCALRGRSQEFWEVNRKGLASINYSLNRFMLTKWIPRVVLEKALEVIWSASDKPHNNDLSTARKVI